MNHWKRPWLLGLGIALLASLPAAAGAYEKSVPSAGLTDVAVFTLSGSVELVGWDQPQVKTEWTDSSPAQAPVFATEAGQLRIGNDPDTGRGLSADLKIFLPPGLKVSVKTISGDLKAAALSGGCRLVSISGEVQAKALTGKLEIKTVSGDVGLDGLQGDLSIKTVSGDLDARGLRAGLVEVKTVSGDVELQGELREVRAASHSGKLTIRAQLGSEGGIQAKSFSGDVTVWLPAKAAFDLDLSSRSGSAHAQHTLQAAEVHPNRATGRVNGGGAELQLSSFSGDVAVRISE